MPRTKAMNVEVEPAILKWAIESSGWTKDDLTKRLKISPNAIDSWTNKQSQPTLKQLEDLAKTIKRPLAVFFLSEPPKDKPLPKDYRMLPGKDGNFDKVTILAIRR